jgi:uncharacterized repeat protein (TIGR01451 family)
LFLFLINNSNAWNITLNLNSPETEDYHNTNEMATIDNNNLLPSKNFIIETSKSDQSVNKNNNFNKINQGINSYVKNEPLIPESLNSSQGELWINVTKEVNPIVIHPCETATISINVTAEGNPIIELPVAVMLVIDTSGSMGAEYENETGVMHSALYYIKNAANTFIDQMDLTNDTIGITSFASTATLNQGLTHNDTAAKNSINSLTYNGFTNTGEGIRIAQQELTENCPPNATPIILLFTDGLPTAHSLEGISCNDNCPTSNNTCTDYARQQSNDSKNANTTIFSIGFTGGIINYGCGPESLTFAKWLLTNISSDEDFYYDAPNATDIEEIYLNISQRIYDIPISNLIVSDFLPSHFIIINNGGGNHSILPNGTQKIEFNRSSLALNELWNINFNITTNELGNSLLTNYNNSNLTYSRNGNLFTEYLPYPRYINVSSPLEIEKNAPLTVNKGSQFNYKIIINNTGHRILDNIIIQDPLSNKITFNSIDSTYSEFDEDNWNYNNNTLIITNMSLNISEMIEFTISVTVSNAASGDIQNTVFGGYSTLTGCTIMDICNSSVITNIYIPPPPSNTNPVAVDDNVSTILDTSLWIDVLANDYDNEGPLDPSTVIVTNDPSNGDAIVNVTSGEIQYTVSNKATVYILVLDGAVADASAGSPYYGFVGEEIFFNGSLSFHTDQEGFIVSWHWNFGDGANGAGETTTHIYSNPGIFDASLTVVGNNGEVDTDNFNVTILKGNNPPLKPTVDGPKMGHKNIPYEFTVFSEDLDNDSIQYIIDWGDGNVNESDFLSNGTAFVIVHTWTSYGEYLISVVAYDNKTESETYESSILIDVISIDGEIKGYLVDEDSDDTYDFFDNIDTGKQTDIEQENSTYLIDSNDDGKWDHTYSQAEGLLTYYEFVYQKYYQKYKSTIPGFETLSILAMIALVMVIIRWRKKMRV